MRMKKVFIFLGLTALSLAWLAYSVWQYSNYVLLYAILSIAGYVSFFVTLYRRLKKFDFIARHVQTLASVIGAVVPLLFFGFILAMYFSWQRYDWLLYVDNQTDNKAVFTVNGKQFFMPAH